MDDLLHFEDFHAGQVFELGSVAVDAEQMLEFARQYDPQPMHTDPSAAAESIHGGLIASGWQTCALVMRLFVGGVLGKAASLGSSGVEAVRWRKPVRPGDVLTARYTILETRPSSTRADRGALHGQWEVWNQAGDLVLTLEAWNHFARRAP